MGYVMLYSESLRLLTPYIDGRICKQREIDIIKTFLRENHKRGSTTPYTAAELQEKDRLRQELIMLHGAHAQKLAVLMSDDCAMSDEQMAVIKKARYDKVRKEKPL